MGTWESARSTTTTPGRGEAVGVHQLAGDQGCCCDGWRAYVAVHVVVVVVAFRVAGGAGWSVKGRVRGGAASPQPLPHVIEMRRVRPDPAVVPPQAGDRVHLVAAEFEIEDVEVLLDPGRGRGLRDHDVA